VLNARTFSAFELMIVDSASSEDLLSVDDSRQSVAALEELGVAVRIERTERPGLTVARKHGVRAARSEVVCFLDDDNEIREEYLRRGVGYFEDDRLGVLVSRVSPRFAAAVPPSIVRRQYLLAINDSLGDAPIVWEPDVAWCLTLGAGLWVRKSVFLEIYSDPPKAILPDRTGRQLISGGDIEIGIWAGRLDYRRAYAPDVRLDHHIPVGRLQTRYFLRLINGVVRSQATLIRLYDLHKPPSRWWRWMRLPAFVVAAVAVAATRRDCLREFAFIVGAELAECLGPYDLPALKELA
ncbi:MAG TPA: glycosyltransferase, partial [Planctomycetaceae bacterium]|nr:glycosyltransferase [Planctomycetaceae bacterium]